jgi:PmbA protein
MTPPPLWAGPPEVPVNLLEMGAQVLDAVRRRSSTAQAEAYLEWSESRSQDFSEGRLENHIVKESRGLGLRVVDEGRLGFASTNLTDSESLARTAEAAVESSAVTQADSNLRLPDPVAVEKSGTLELLDPKLAEGTFESRSSFLASVNESLKKRDPRIAKVLRASYREGLFQTALASHTGASDGSEGSSFSFSLACVAVEGQETQVGYGFQAVRHYSDLDPEWLIGRTVSNTLSLLGGKQVASGRYDLLLDPWVAAEMLELLAQAWCADQAQKGKSFLAGHVGEKIGAPCLTIVDDGRLARGLGSSWRDGEGWPTQTTVLLEAGVLKGFLYDSTSARRENKRSTGNAGRSSYRGMPEPDPTNFFVRPGSQTPEQMIASIDSGLYVHNVMGLHTVDTASGDYSLGIMGERIEKGKRIHGVRGVTIAGNLLDMMKGVAAVGNDLVFSGTLGAPTLWVRGISVGGS